MRMLAKQTHCFRNSCVPTAAFPCSSLKSLLLPTVLPAQYDRGFSDARPVSQRVFMSGHELDGELHVARAAQRLDALLDLGLACRKRGSRWGSSGANDLNP
jgi:hypothetical protein